MTVCFMLGCENEAVHKIDDAEEFPKLFNGKKICKECQGNRELLKTDEPSHEEESK